MTEPKRKHKPTIDDVKLLIAIPDGKIISRFIEVKSEESIDTRIPELRVRIEVEALMNDFSPEWLEERASELLTRANDLRGRQ